MFAKLSRFRNFGKQIRTKFTPFCKEETQGLHSTKYEISQKSVCCFHSNSTLHEKIFLNKENQYAHNVLANTGNSNYNLFLENKKDSIVELKQNIDDVLKNISLIQEPSEVVENFKFIAVHCQQTNTCISNEKFDKFVDLLMERCDEFTDEQLTDSLKYLMLLPETESTSTRNFVEIWKSLDAECVRRIEKWQTNQLLYVCDCWYALNLARPCEFVWAALRKLGRKIKKLNPQQLTQTMFLCNTVRKAVLEMFDFEVNFAECIKEMSLKEISVMSMGFFKTQTPIRNNTLIENIYKRLMIELETVDDICLVNILKILRYSTKLQQVHLMDELLEKICPQIERLTLVSCLHVALLGTDIHHFHEKCISKIVNRFNNEVQNSRLKDMERICLVLSLFDFTSKTLVEEELCSKIIQQLKTRAEEITRHPRCFSNCLHFLSIKGFYDFELLNEALSKQFIKHAYGTNLLLGREMFCIDSFVRINLKDKYNGNTLSDKNRNAMGKCLTHYIPERNQKYKLNATDKILLEVKEACVEIYLTCILKLILPHFQRPDVVICYYKETNRSLPLSKNIPGDYSGTILTRDILLGEENAKKATIKTGIIVVAGWNNFIRSKENRYTGIFKLKLNQLQLIGHNVVVIPWYEWRELETVTDRHDYIRRKLALFM